MPTFLISEQAVVKRLISLRSSRARNQQLRLSHRRFALTRQGVEHRGRLELCTVRPHVRKLRSCNGRFPHPVCPCPRSRRRRVHPPAVPGTRRRGEPESLSLAIWRSRGACRWRRRSRGSMPSPSGFGRHWNAFVTCYPCQVSRRPPSAAPGPWGVPLWHTSEGPPAGGYLRLTRGLPVACWWLPCAGSLGAPKCDTVAHFVGLTLSL